jgi:hypothetical protein
MAETTIGKKASTRADQWRERIAEQGHSGLSVKQFCTERGLTEGSFYAWRKRLRVDHAVRFALVERRAAGPEPATECQVELVLSSGERLRIGKGVDGATLRTVIEALRA